MYRPKAVFLNLVCAFAFFRCGYTEYPRISRSIWWRPYVYDAGTCSLFHLDKKKKAEEPIDMDVVEKPADEKNIEGLMPAIGNEPETGEEETSRTARNAVPGANAADLLGDYVFTEKGRFNGGLLFPKGKGALICKNIDAKAGARCVELWLFLDVYPATSAVLFQHAPAPRRRHGQYNARQWNETLTPLALEITRQGGLELVSKFSRKAFPRARVPLKRWVHLSLSVTCAWPHGNAAHIFLNGKPGGKIDLEEDVAVKIARFSEALAVGNNFAGKRGIRGSIDELRISSVYRNYYEYNLDWPAPDMPARAGPGQPYFRDPDDLLFHLSFNGSLKPDKCAPGTEYPNFMLTPQDLELNVRKKAEKLPAGVQGRCLLLGQGSLRPVYGARGNISPPRGTIAFWMQPLDWDNYTRDNRYDKIPPTSFGLFQLDAVGVKGSHEAQFHRVVRMLQFTVHMHMPEEVNHPVRLAPGTWYHVAITWEGASFTYYVNGRKRSPDGAFEVHANIRTAGDPYPFRNSNPHWWTECRPTRLLFQENRYWEQTGLPMPRTLLDDFRIYRRPLAPSEIANLASLYDPRRQLRHLPPADMELYYNSVLGKVTASIIPLIPNWRDVVAARLRVRKASEKRDIANATRRFDETRQGTVTVKTPPMEFATYSVTAELLDKGGKVMESFSKSFTRQAPPWWNCRAGVSDKAMPEWDPVRVRGRRVFISRREIVVARSGLPERVISARADVLAGPVELTVQSDGLPIVLRGAARSPKLIKQTDARADFSGKLSSELLAVNTRMYIEFDGMMWFDLVLSPRGPGEVKIDSLRVKIPYRLENAEYVHWWSGRPNFRDQRPPQNVYIGTLPQGTDTVFRSNDRELVQHPGTLRGSFIPYVMLTGMKRGMAWFAENDRGWTPNTRVPAVLIRRDGRTVSLLLNVISIPVSLKGPRSFSFGLHPIPVRKLDPDWRKFPGGISSCIPDSFSGNNLKGRKGPTAFALYPEDNWDAVMRRINGEGLTKGAAGLKRIYEDQLRRFRKLGRKPLPIELIVPGLYLDLQWSGPHPSHTREWVEAWGLGHGDYQYYTKEFIDYTAWAWNEWILKTGKFIQGAYLDDTWCAPQSKLGGPVAYALPDGHVQPGFQFRGYRERVKRMRQISWDNGIVPHLTAHTTHTYLIPYHSFFDTILDGEDHYSSPPRQDDFIDHWPLDRMRFMHSEKWGQITIWLCWCGNALRPQKWPAWAFRQTRAYVAHLAQHDIAWLFDPKVIQKFGLRERDTVFIPYWAKDPVAVCTDPDVKVTVWKRRDRCLVLLVNVGKAISNVTVRFDMAALELPAANTKVTDVDPTLLTYFEEDATTQKTPRVPDEPVLMGNGTAEEDDETAAQELGETPDKLPLEERKARDPEGKYEWENGVLKCPVRRHDYRLFLFQKPNHQAAE